MLEAKEGCAYLEDTDERIFLLFSQYAYAGDYITGTADPEKMSNAPAINTVPASNEILPNKIKRTIAPLHFHGDDDDDFEPASILEVDHFPFGCLGRAPVMVVKGSNKSGKTNAEASKKYMLWNSFKSKKYTTSKPFPLTCGNTVEISENRAKDYFRDHARLYLFADKYDIGPLRNLSLQKLHQALVRYNLRDELVERVVDLIEYSYSNTMDLSGSVDELRLLVISYVACVAKNLAHNDRFQSLLEQPGPVARDLIVQILQLD